MNAQYNNWPREVAKLYESGVEIITGLSEKTTYIRKDGTVGDLIAVIPDREWHVKDEEVTCE